MQLVILGSNLTIQSGQAGSMTYHFTFEYISIGLLTICLAMVAFLFCELNAYWLDGPQPKKQVSQLTRTTQTKPHLKHRVTLN